MLCVYRGHSAFSIFAQQVKFHEQMLIQIEEGEFPEEEQPDESFLESNILRRLFQVLNIQTPDMV